MSLHKQDLAGASSRPLPIARRAAMAGAAGRRSVAFALEPRWLFDGAGFACVDPVLAAADPAGDRVADQAEGAVGDRAAGPVAATDGAVVDAAPAAGGESTEADAADAVALDVSKGSFASAAERDAAIADGADAVRGADAGDVDAGDSVYFAIRVDNAGASVWNLQLVDHLPPGTDPASVRNLQLRDAAGRPVDYRTGDVIRAVGDGSPIHDEHALAAALFGEGIAFVDPGPQRGFLPAADCAGAPAGVAITYAIAVGDDAVAGSLICTQAEVIGASTSDCGPNVFACGDGPSDGATIGIAGATIDTTLVDTLAGHTDGATVVVGEVLVYRTVVVVPEGISPDAVLVQDLGPGMALVGVDWIATSDGLQTGPLPDPSSIVPTDADGGQANRFRIDFGCVVNADRDDGTAQTLTVQFRAVALNVAANQDGTALVETANWRSTAGAGGAVLVDVCAAAAPATVAEPHLVVTVSPQGGATAPGGVAEFTVAIRNDGPVAAFDIGLDAIALPPGLVLRPDSVRPQAGSDGSRLAPGETLVYRFQADVGRDAPRGTELRAPVTVRYTSLPDQAAGNRQAATDLSPFVAARPGGAPAADAERTGVDGPGGLNDYVASATGSVLPVVAVLPAAPPVPVAESPAPAPAAVPPATTFVPVLPVERTVAPVLPPLAAIGRPLSDLAPLVSEPFAPLAAQDVELKALGLPAGDDGPAKEAADDCVPVKAKPKPTKPVAATRAGLADAVGKPPVKRNFTEQVEAAKQRFQAPPIARPRAAPDC